MPGVYADVSKSMCFIDYATKCMLGQDTNYYGINGCKHWAEETYCNIEKELEKVQDKISNVSTIFQSIDITHLLY